MSTKSDKKSEKKTTEDFEKALDKMLNMPPDKKDGGSGKSRTRNKS